MFFASRLKVARQRAGLTKAALAESVGVAARAITGFEAGEYEPTTETFERLSSVLGYPVEFFMAGDIEVVDAGAVSFRSLTRMSARQRDAAVAAASLAYIVSEWADRNYELPNVDLPDLSALSPSVAASSLRQRWGLGYAPISNVLDLIEAKGIRVFSLMEYGNEVDAYSVWRGTRPFIFLNTGKSSERRRFDLVHELAHLVLHRSQPGGGGNAEKEANEFAGAFLMPEESLRAVGRIPLTLDGLIRIKSIWKVSVAALLYRLKEVGLITYYNFNRLFVELSSLGYRTNEPESAAVEQSQIWRQVFSDALSSGQNFAELAAELRIPSFELSRLLIGLATLPVPSSPGVKGGARRGVLRVVK